MSAARLSIEQFRQARDLFEAAVDAPPADLQSWLQARTDDPLVRAEVSSLLQHHSVAGGFLTEPVGNLDALLDEETPAEAESADAAQRAAVLQPGQMLGRYRIEAEAGRGGMGRVYRAIDTHLNRSVAIKALPAAMAADASQRERLRREAQAAAALNAPGICTVHALEIIDDQLFIVSEFVEGETLQAVIARGGPPRPPAEVIDMARQLAAALASAHARGITHRDLKPENIMRTGDGRLKILDFGLARQAAGEGGAAAMVTQAGAIVGTPAYMAPEQLNGQPADARTDLFALGVVLYEFATGQHPFAAETALARAGRILEATPVSLGSLRPDLPGWFVAVIGRCLSKAPGERFADAAALLRSLERQDDPSVASPPGPRSHSTPPANLVAADANRTPDLRTWWRLHQVVVISLYVVAVVFAWFIKEWVRGTASWVFIALGLLGTIIGMLRGHLVFTERTHGVGLEAERHRLEPVTLVGDLAMSLLLAVDAIALIAASREVAGVFAIALAAGLTVARVVLETGTSRAAFGRDER